MDREAQGRRSTVTAAAYVRLASLMPQIAVLSRPERGLWRQMIISFKPYYYFIRSVAENTTALKFISFYHVAVIFFPFPSLCFQGETVASRGKESFASAKATEQHRARRHSSITPPPARRRGSEQRGSGGDPPRCRAFLRRLFLLHASGSEMRLCGRRAEQ